MHGRAWSREEALATLESPERMAGRSAERLWDRVRLAEGETVVDVGAGTGFYALPAARRVGPTGRVYATDLSRELVGLIRERATSAGFGQLTALENTLTRIPVPSRVADVVLLANVLHDFPESTVGEAVRLLKPDGRFVNVDWKKEETVGGPPLHIRFTPEEAAERLARHGLVVVDRWDDGPAQYGLLLRRTDPAVPDPRGIPP